jgi:pimeloyl-ACP methyl ester carboxylesterase
MPKVHLNGIDLYYEVHGQGEPVLLVPGFTADHNMWMLQIPALASQFQVIVPDNRGSGQSSQPEGPYTIRQMADDAAALLEHLGIAKAHIVGASMGGAIVQEFALAYPEKVHSLAILCSWARGDAITAKKLELWKKAYLRLEPEDCLEFTLQSCLTHRFYELPGAVDMLKMNLLANPFPQTPAGFFGQAAACEAHDTLDRLEGILAPTLVWGAAEDLLLPPRMARAIAERIPGAEYYEMPEVSHMFVIEQSDLSNAKLREWLGRHAMAKAATA